MNKIPVGETISRAYSFAFSDLLSIFGVMWFPYLLFFAICAGLVLLAVPELPRMISQQQFDPMAFVGLVRIGGLIGLMAFIVGAMVTVGVQRKAQGLHPGAVYFYFSLGAPVWRMLGAFFLAVLLIILSTAISAGLCVAIWFAAGSYAPAFEWPVRVVAIVVAVLWYFYMTVRLMFFLPAVVVAEERIGLGRSWELGGGNFWRIFVVWIAVFFPVIIGFSMISQAVFGSVIPFGAFHPNMTPQEILRIVLPQLLAMGPFIVLFQLIERIVLTGLANGAIANAYLAVVPKPSTMVPAADAHA
jgi:hypothetical protein